MSHILVSGLINVETTVRVDGFPIEHSPVRYPFFGVQSRVSGVGYNVSKALTTLGDEVSFLSLVGRDAAAIQVRHALEQDHIPAHYVLSEGEQTAQSVILYDDRGRRLRFSSRAAVRLVLPPAISRNTERSRPDRFFHKLPSRAGGSMRKASPSS